MKDIIKHYEIESDKDGVFPYKVSQHLKDWLIQKYKEDKDYPQKLFKLADERAKEVRKKTIKKVYKEIDMQESLYALKVWGKTFGRAYSKDYKEYDKEIRKKYREKRDKLKIKEGKSKKHPSNSFEKPIF